MTEPPRDPRRFAQIDDAFARALELDTRARAEWLAGLRERDAGLAAAVERLLAAAAQPDPRLDPERFHWRALPGPSVPEPVRPGDTIGAYRVLREIGRGGMSVVYLAERVDGLFEQRVAVKFLGSAHEVSLRRFERERQILAGLAHPHIARLLDGGNDEHGRPYIVMEHVAGRPLDVYCREAGAGLRRRLELVSVIADAVEYAHRHLVVHRDLKPSNILITDDGQVKLLDFGIAKLLTPTEDGAPATRTQFRALTPEYASPEQVRGERITTASDVYQLGALLYELLSGRRPSSLAQNGAGPAELALRGTEPPPPSATAARERHTLPGIDDPVALRRRVRGDLDSIVLKALAPEPERRYASVGEFRDDIRRFLDGTPVRARVATPLYRAMKFVARHRTVAAAGLLIAGLVAAYVVTLTAQSRRLVAEAAKTNQVKEILVSLLATANPGISQGREPTASELLELGARRVADLHDQPDVQAELLTLLGEVYGTLGRYDEAADLLAPALELRRRLLQPGDPEVARTAHRLAQVRHVQGRLDEAESLMREAIEIQQRALGERSGTLGISLDELGDLLHTRGDLVEAEAVLRRALRVLEHAGFFAAGTESKLANVLRDRGAFAHAESLYHHALGAAEARFGALDPIASLTRSELAVLLAETDRHQLADSLLQLNLHVYGTIYPAGHAMVGTTLRNVGILRLRQGDAHAATRSLHDAVAVYRTTIGVETSLIPRAQRYLAEALLAAGDVEAAEREAAAALDALRRQGLGAHPAATDVLEILALAAMHAGEPQRAVDLLAEALARRERLSVPGDPRLDTTRERLATAAFRTRMTGDHAAGAAPH